MHISQLRASILKLLALIVVTHVLALVPACDTEATAPDQSPKQAADYATLVDS